MWEGGWALRLKFGSAAAAALAGLALGVALTVLAAGLTPAGVGGAVRAYAALLRSPGVVVDVLPYFAAITLTAAGLAAAYRAGFITIGGEGSLIAGVLAGYGVYLALGSTPFTLPAAVAAAAAAGMLLQLAVAVLRVYAGINETLVSLMLNYIMLSLLNYLVTGPWSVGAFTKTEPLPRELMRTPLLAAAAAVAVAAGYEALLRYTRLGIALDSLGLARRAALTYGVSLSRSYAAAALLAGASAGLAGALYLYTSLGAVYARSQSYGYGYIGILAAWLAGLSPLLTVPAGLLLASLYMVNAGLQLGGTGESFAQAMQAIIVLSTVALSTYASKKRVLGGR